ncbi:MAG: tRNA ((37)-C2)-methylthiotransferase MiaB, partial [Bacteroidota bacterium]
VYIETYGCQMNVADSEVVLTILNQAGYSPVEDYKKADVILINTCSIRDNAEQRVFNRLNVFKSYKRKHKPTMLIGIIGCMAERLKDELLEREKLVDIVVGPDAYRDLPNLVAKAGSGQKAINVLLSREETYADISPVRIGDNKISAFVSIMRGCDKMCAYCVVPFTRGRERSRAPESILSEVQDLIDGGYKEVTLLGQNVDSYKWTVQGSDTIVNFAQLLEQVAVLDPTLRIRFSTSYPTDMTNEVLHVMAAHRNICKAIHLPVQAGSTRMLNQMRRQYTRESYMERIQAIRQILPECAISTDIITGFAGETDDDHAQTISMMEWVGYEFAYMFKYSERDNTFAQRQLPDDVPDEIKTARLEEVIAVQQKVAELSNQKDIGKTFEVLVEGISKRSHEHLYGRTSQNKVLVFPKQLGIEAGTYVDVIVTSCTTATLLGKMV